MMNPQMGQDPMQLYAMLMQAMQQPQPQIPNAQAGMPMGMPPQRPQMPNQPQPQAAPPTQQQPPGAGGQIAQNAAAGAATAGASAINPMFGILMQAIMPQLLQSLFGQKQQPMPAQVIPAPR